MANRLRRRQERDEDEGLGSFFLGAMLGGLVGALAAIWYAPQSGEELRRTLQERGTGIFDDIEYAASRTRRRFERESIEDAMREGRAEARRFRQERD